jgi:hypothetical protein
MSKAKAKKSGQPSTSATAEILYGSNNFGSHVEIGGVGVQLGTVVARAQADSGLSAEEWNALEEVKRDSAIRTTISALAEDAETAGRVDGSVDAGDQDSNPEAKQPSTSATASKRPDSVRLLCTLPNCSELIGGVRFAPAKGGMVSEEIPAEKAKRWLTIPGYELARQ